MGKHVLELIEARYMLVGCDKHGLGLNVGDNGGWMATDYAIRTFWCLSGLDICWLGAISTVWGLTTRTLGGSYGGLCV